MYQLLEPNYRLNTIQNYFTTQRKKANTLFYKKFETIKQLKQNNFYNFKSFQRANSIKETVDQSRQPSIDDTNKLDNIDISTTNSTNVYT